MTEPASSAQAASDSKGPASINLPQHPESPARIGRTDLGRIDVTPTAVEKVAALAAVEIPDAGGGAARMLGRPLPGSGHLGIRGSGLDRLPKVSAAVDGQLGFLDVELSVRWPSPVTRVTEAVRQHLSRRVGELVGLEIREVNINVVDLITDTPSARVS